MTSIITHQKKLFMKKYFQLLSMLLVALMTTFFLACSSSDDDKSEGSSSESTEEINGEDITLPTPKYLNDAAVYKVTSSDSEYESIELTESGYAVITMREGYDARTVTRGIFPDQFTEPSIIRVQTRYGDDDSWTPQCYWLRYEKIGDGTYRMWHIVGTQAGQEWGTLKVAKDDPTDPVNARLEITRANGYPQVIQTRWDDLYKSDLASQSLCRSWEFDKIVIDGMKSSANGSNSKKVKEEFTNWRQVYQWMIDELMNGKKPADLGWNFTPDVDDLFEVPVQIIFTRSGTYIVFYDDGTATINNWVWAEHEPPYKTIHYSHDLNNLYKDGASGEVTHSYDYDGKRGVYILKIFEQMSDMYTYDYEVKLSLNMTYYMHPVTEK